MRVERWTCGVALWVAACGGVSSSTLFSDNAGVDGGAATPHPVSSGSAGNDSGGKDSGVILVAGKDATVAPHDAAMTTIVPDAGVAPSHDAGMNPPPVGKPDAAKDTGTTPPPGPSIPCGATACMGTLDVCCVTGARTNNPTSTCESAASACTNSGGVPLTCQTSTDCPTGETCCATLDQQYNPTQVSCEANCQGAEVCDPTGLDTCMGLGATCMRISNTLPYGYCSMGLGVPGD